MNKQCYVYTTLEVLLCQLTCKVGMPVCDEYIDKDGYSARRDYLFKHCSYVQYEPDRRLFKVYFIGIGDDIPEGGSLREWFMEDIFKQMDDSDYRPVNQG